MLEQKRIRESDGRKVAEAIGKQQSVNRAECLRASNQPEQNCANKMQRSEHAFGGEETIGHEADEKRGNHGRDGRCAKYRAGLGAGEVQCARQIGSNCDVPRAPDHVVQEHHDAEARADGKGHEENSTPSAWRKPAESDSAVGRVCISRTYCGGGGGGGGPPGPPGPRPAIGGGAAGFCSP